MARGMRVPEKSKRGIKGLLKELFSYSKKLKVPMCIALLLAVAGAVLTIIGPNRLSRITDLISEGLTSQIDLPAIAEVGVLLIGLYLLSGLFTYIEHYIMATVTLDLSKRMRKDLSDKINKVPMKYFNKVSYGDILSRVTNDVSTLQQALSNSAVHHQRRGTVCRLSDHDVRDRVEDGVGGRRGDAAWLRYHGVDCFQIPEVFCRPPAEPRKAQRLRGGNVLRPRCGADLPREPEG